MSQSLHLNISFSSSFWNVEGCLKSFVSVSMNLLLLRRKLLLLFPGDYFSFLLEFHLNFVFARLTFSLHNLASIAFISVVLIRRHCVIKITFTDCQCILFPYDDPFAPFPPFASTVCLSSPASCFEFLLSIRLFTCHLGYNHFYFLHYYGLTYFATHAILCLEV
ncbi:hypothetical protein BDP27DRAFT_347414 [Rhodocollybia butyracea]|uniref:Uncharacterized protein n=1 Tax=Rhodocollybia butyracea TaxID=206335 RepID=A0A9P5QBP8_9AGAR|nr:hypothetical protein BDP27DRAFT_347414 [Rhodocollybia butyracea]